MKQVNNKPTMVRVQLDLPEKRIEELEALRAKTGMTTRKDVFENALTLIEWVVGQIEKGRVIASIDENEDGYRELVMPALASIKNEAKNTTATKTQEVAKAGT